MLFEHNQIQAFVNPTIEQMQTILDNNVHLLGIAVFDKIALFAGIKTSSTNMMITMRDIISDTIGTVDEWIGSGDEIEFEIINGLIYPAGFNSNDDDASDFNRYQMQELSSYPSIMNLGLEFAPGLVKDEADIELDEIFNSDGYDPEYEEEE